MGYEFLSHTADVKFKATGKNVEEAFISVADALFETMGGGAKVGSTIEKQIELSEKDNYSLLYSFVEEFIFLLDSEGFIPSSIKSLTIEKNSLKAVILGDKAKHYTLSTEVKSMTYSDMNIEEKENNVIITGVFDV